MGDDREHAIPVSSVSQLPLGVVIVAAVGIRCWRIPQRSLWFDEAFSWRVATFPIPEMLARTAGDNHPPLHFALLKAWMALWGESEWSLRSLSVVAGAITVVGMFGLLRTVFRHGLVPASSDISISETDKTAPSVEGLALLGAALVAVSIFHIRWSWEARMYTVGTAFAIFSSWSLWRALHAESGRWRNWIAYGLLALAFLYTHYYALFTIAAQTLFAVGFLLCRRRSALADGVRELRGVALSLLIVALGFLPWLPNLLSQRAQVQEAFWARKLQSYSVPLVLYQMFVEPEDPTYSVTANNVATVFTVGVLLALLWRPTAGDWFLFLSATIPFAASVLVTILDTKIFHVRYFLFAHLFVLAAMASVVWKLFANRLERTVVSAGLLVTGVLIYVAFLEKMDIPNRPGVKGATAWIADHRGPAEPVVVCSPLFYFPVLYHLPGRSDCYLFSDGTPVVHYEGGSAVLSEDLITLDGLRDVRSDRVWVINMNGGYWGKRTVPVPAEWRLVEQAVFREAYGVQGQAIVELYETRAT